MTSPNWYIIANPTAGNNATYKQWRNILLALDKAELEYEAVFTEHKGHAIELTKAAIEAGHRYIIGVGGDGTNNEMINGIMQQTVVPTHEITYALIPVGTGNDWIRTHNIPKNIKKAIDLIKVGHTRQQDIGLATFQKDNTLQQRYFVNVAGLAYDGFIAKAMDENEKPISNPLVYLYMIFTNLFKYKPINTRVAFKDEKGNHQIDGEVYTVNIGICKYSGNNMQLVPHAIADDGLLALTVATTMPKWKVLGSTPYFYNGRLKNHSHVSLFQTKMIEVSALDGQPLFLEADGEYLGEAPSTINILPNALTFIASPQQ